MLVAVGSAPKAARISPPAAVMAMTSPFLAVAVVAWLLALDVMFSDARGYALSTDTSGAMSVAKVIATVAIADPQKHKSPPVSGRNFPLCGKCRIIVSASSQKRNDDASRLSASDRCLCPSGVRSL